MPNGIQFNWTGADAIYPNPNKTAIQPMTGIRFPQPDEIRIPCPVAVPIMNHYVQRAFPIKTTLRWMDYASEKSKSKSGTGEESGYSIGGSLSLGGDIGKSLFKSYEGEINGEWQQKWSLAYSFYIEQGKKYLLEMKLGKVTDEYRDPQNKNTLVGLKWNHKGKAYESDIGNANGWLQSCNKKMDELLEDHFKSLSQITAGGK